MHQHTYPGGEGGGVRCGSRRRGRRGTGRTRGQEKKENCQGEERHTILSLVFLREGDGGVQPLPPLSLGNIKGRIRVAGGIEQERVYIGVKYVAKEEHKNEKERSAARLFISFSVGKETDEPPSLP